MQSHSFLLILFLAAGAAASGQQLAIPKKNPDSIQGKSWLSGSGTLSHTTSNGKVYIMPVDHMRCLVPDMKKLAPMAVVKPHVPERMPNGFSQIPKGSPHKLRERDE